jgi:hypothetical protein
VACRGDGVRRSGAEKCVSLVPGDFVTTSGFIGQELIVGRRRLILTG